MIFIYLVLNNINRNYLLLFIELSFNFDVDITNTIPETPL